jgi:hypothetical protein
MGAAELVHSSVRTGSMLVQGRSPSDRNDRLDHWLSACVEGAAVLAEHHALHVRRKGWWGTCRAVDSPSAPAAPSPPRRHASRSRGRCA